MAKRKGISKKTRFDVFKRDSFTCQYCGKSAPDVVLEVDHINPVSKGGDNDISNLITACFDCNRGKRDKKLTENQAIKKQKEELDKLNKRREQLEMMAQWRTELLDLENEEADKIMKLVSDSLGLNSQLTDTGRVKMKRLIKKYGFEEVLECSLIAYEQYDINIAFSKIEPIIKNKKMQQEHPEMKDLFYIRAIVKNKFSYYDLNTAIILLKKCYELGATIDSLKDFTKGCENWTQWKDGMNRFIKENQDNVDDESEVERKYMELCGETELSDSIEDFRMGIAELYTKLFINLYNNGYSLNDIRIIADYLNEMSDELIYAVGMNDLFKYAKREL